MRFTLFAALLPLGLAAPFQQIPLQSPGQALSLPALNELAISGHELLQLREYIESLPEQRLVKFSEEDEGHWVTEGEKALLVLAGRRFVDVTDEPGQGVISATTTDAEKALPDALAFNRTDLESAFAELSIARVKSTLQEFTSFRTRHYRSSTGRESQLFLLGLINDIVSLRPELNITVHEFKHAWGQNSIIVRIPASPKADSEAPVVIVGAHQDSTNMLPFLPAPVRSSLVRNKTPPFNFCLAHCHRERMTTAAVQSPPLRHSVVCLHTVARVIRLILYTLIMRGWLPAPIALMAIGFVPESYPLEFHYYSAEEAGLLGSQAIARAYQQQGKAGRAMLQVRAPDAFPPLYEARN
jgi:bacterial leucyl aminopeptidase